MKQLAAVILSLALSANLLAEIRLTDDLGREVVLAEAAERIVTLIPHATELLFEIGAGDRIVATVAYSDYPDEARRIQRIGDFNNLNTEAIVALQPDLLIAFTSAPNLDDIDRLKELGLRVFHSDPQTFGEIARTLRQFGQLTGRTAAAEAVAAEFEADIAALRSMYADKTPLSVFYEVWHEPIFTLNGDSYISDIIEVCGGYNVFAELPVISPQVSLEAVFERDPEVIVSAPPAAGEDSPWLEWPQLQAVANKALIHIDPDDMHRPTPSLVTGATQLCRAMDELRSRYER